MVIHLSNLYPVVAWVRAAVVERHQDGLAAETVIAFQVQLEVEGPEPAGTPRKEAKATAGEELSLETGQGVVRRKAGRLLEHEFTHRGAEYCWLARTDHN
jgi:hypothetical protein